MKTTPAVHPVWRFEMFRGVADADCKVCKVISIQRRGLIKRKPASHASGLIEMQIMIKVYMPSIGVGEIAMKANNEYQVTNFEISWNRRLLAKQWGSRPVW